MIAVDPLHPVRELARQGRLAQALSLIVPLVAQARPDPEALELQAMLFKMAGDAEAALTPQRRITMLYPQRRSGWHNLAATLGDLGLASEAEEAARRTLTLAPPAPETQLVLGRSLQSQGRYDAAEGAFLDALALRPLYAEAHRDLAQLRWMRTGDVGHALSRLDTAGGQDASLAMVRAEVLEFSGDLAGAGQALARAVAREPSNAALRLAASNLDLALGRVGAALAHAKAVHAAVPQAPPVVLVPLIQALLADGQAAEAARLAEDWRRRAPDDQLAIALQLTAWRALGDERYAAWSASGLVRAFTIETPDGWSTLAAYLGDLRSSLLALHDLKTHPLHQSLRGGSQTSRSLLRSDDPAITAFFEAIRRPLSDYMAALGPGEDPLRRRNTGSGAPKAAWSVNLRPGGRHANHVHPQGWISSAFYVATPDEALAGDDQAGWIRFGEPPFPVSPAQPPQHAVRPEPGRLVLFPSYMWHGTAPFSTDETRLTIAFDVLPT